MNHKYKIYFNSIYMENITFIILWIIGTILSFVVIWKYVQPISMYKHFYYQIKNSQQKKFYVIGIIVFTLVIIGYLILSWIGAIITYNCWNSEKYSYET